MRQLITFFWAICMPFLLNAQTTNEFPTDSAATSTEIQPVVKHSEKKITTSLKKYSPYIGPAAMFSFGLLANKNAQLQNLNRQIRDEVLENNNRFHSTPEDYLQYMPVQAVFALNMVGLKSQNNFVDRAFLYALSNTIMSQSVDKLKTISRKLRPDGSDHRSFPSGHTATAFSAAEFMRLEYKDVSPVYGIAAYAVAATTGALRIYHNNHWFSDVVAGAGIGILSTDLSYFIYPRVKKFVANTLKIKTNNLHVGPTYQSKTFGLALVYNPK